MADNKTDFLEDAILDLIFNNVVFTGQTPHLALFTSATGEAGGGTEVTGGSYARQSLVASFPASSGGVVASDAVITFPTATASWGTITHHGIMDALTAGNMMYHGIFATSKIIDTDDIFEILVGDLSIQEL